MMATRQQLQLRLRAGSQRERNSAPRRRRIIRARRPPRRPPATNAPPALSSPTSVADSNINEVAMPNLPEEDSKETSYEEAVAAAAAVLYSGQNNHDDDAEDTDANAIEMPEVYASSNTDESPSVSSTENESNAASISNRFDALMDDESSSGSEGGGSEVDDGEHQNSINSNSNRFNLLMDDASSSESEDDDSALSLPRLEGIRSKAKAYSIAANEDESDDDDDTAKCAVCFLSDDQCHKWRRLMTLPCCGLDGKEKSSSTRFCAACILQMAMTRPDASTRNEYNPWDDERFEAPARQFYRNDVQTQTRRVIECPRCRDVLVVNIKKPTSSNANDDSDDESMECDCSDCQPNSSRDDWTNPNTAKSISVRTPTFKERCRYAGKKVGIARILWRAAFLHHSFMPRLVLGGATGGESDIPRLVSWGVLHKVSSGKGNNEVFRMNGCDQMELIKLLGVPTLHTAGGYGRNDVLILDLLAGLGCAILAFLMNFRVDRALRAMNRFGLLALFFKDYLPPSWPLSMWQEWVVTALNVFAAATIIQFFFIAVVYAGSFFGVILTVCYLLRRTRSLKSGWQCFSLGSGLVLGLSYFACGVFTSVYNRAGMVAPKAVMTLTTFIGGGILYEFVIAVANASVCFVAGRVVSYLLRPNNWSEVFDFQFCLCLGSCLVYRAATFVFSSSFIKWLGMVAPEKAILDFKNFIWG